MASAMLLAPGTVARLGVMPRWLLADADRWRFGSAGRSYRPLRTPPIYEHSRPRRVGDEMQQRLVLGRDPGRRRYGFDHEALAQHDLVSQGHQVVPHVPADTGDEVQAALPKCLEQVLTDIAFVGVELAGQVPGDLIQHGAVGGVAGGDF